MISVGGEFIATLKASTFSLGTVNAHEAYNDTAPKYPLLTLDEIPTNTGVYLDNQPGIVRNIFTLEAYAKAMTVNGSIIAKRSASLTLLMEADKVLNEKYGITMTGTPVGAPYSDQTVFRWVANYFAYIDTRTNTIYRSINKGG